MSSIKATSKELKDAFYYEPQTGKLWWSSHFLIPEKKQGKLATKHYHENILSVNVRSHTVAAHRIIWCMQTGEWPPGPIRHRNSDGTDNRWDNLTVDTWNYRKSNPERGEKTRDHERRDATQAAQATPQPVDLTAPGW